MLTVGARPDQLRRLATVLGRAAEDVAWLRRRVDGAQDRARAHSADTRTLARLEVWLADGAVDLRRRAMQLEDGWRPRGGLLDDFHPPGVSGGGCGSVQLPVLARRAETDGRDSSLGSLGEPLFASAALTCMAPVRLAEDAPRLIVTPDGTLVLASRGSKRGRGGAGAGGPAPPKKTKDEILDKVRLPHGDDKPFGFEPDEKWHPGSGCHGTPRCGAISTTRRTSGARVRPAHRENRLNGTSN